MCSQFNGICDGGAASSCEKEIGFLTSVYINFSPRKFFTLCVSTVVAFDAFSELAVCFCSSAYIRTENHQCSGTNKWKLIPQRLVACLSNEES